MSKIGQILKTAEQVLLRPRITERSTAQAASVEYPVYTFEIAQTATKPEVARAVRALYRVTPLKVATVVVGPRRVTVRGRVGYRPGFKKALVYLKKGDKIDFV